jgi:hypothetical protein
LLKEVVPSVELSSRFSLSSLTNVLKAASTSGGILLGLFALQVAPALRVEMLPKSSAWAIEHELAAT